MPVVSPTAISISSGTASSRTSGGRAGGRSVADVEIELGGGAVLRGFRLEDAEALHAAVDASLVRLARWLPWDDGSKLDYQRRWQESTISGEQPYAPAGIWL